MAISFETLKTLMPKIGLEKFEVKEESNSRGRLLSGFNLDSGDSQYPKMQAGVVLSLQEDGEFVQMRAVQMLDRDAVLASNYKAELARFFLQKNYENKIGRWCLDSSDGDIYIDWAIPVEDNPTLTERQLKRLLSGLVSCLKEAWGPMHRILETGSEIQLNADDLKKEILLVLMKNNKFELMQSLGACDDVTILAKVKVLVDRGSFDEAKRLLQQ